MRSETEGMPIVSGVLESIPSDLPLHAWEALPLPIRVQHRLAEILVLVDELRAVMRDEPAGPLRWVDMEVETIGDSVESVLERLAC